MLEDDVDVLLAGDVPDRLAELARLLGPLVVLRRVDLRQLAPAVEVLAVDGAAGAELHDVVALRLVRDDADGVGAGRRAELHAEDAKPPGGDGPGGRTASGRRSRASACSRPIPAR